MDTTMPQGGGEKSQLPRDVFLYFLMVGTLAVAAVNVGTLLFQFISLYVPDPATDQYWSAIGALQAIRWSVASLVVVFPVLLWVTRFLNRDIAANPAKRDLRIRKWLLSLTLFVAGVIIIGDLVSLVYSYLQGELTLRFSLKVLSVLLISGTVFYYYLQQMHMKGGALVRAVGWAAIGLVAVAVIAGFVAVGSPATQRAYRLDEQRVTDLQMLQGQITYYWQAKEQLPRSLADLRDTSVSGFTAPLDPESGVAYTYTVTGATKFSLCAVFTRPSRFAGQTYPGNEDWSHGSGTVCFERVIDPAFYPRLKANIQ